MKKIIIFIMAVSLIACNAENLLFAPVIKSGQQPLTYQLEQMHFVILTQIEHLICIDTDSSSEIGDYKFLDVHLAWLKFSNDSTSNYYPYEITHSVAYTTDLKDVSAEDLLTRAFVYDNGFRIDSSNLVEVNSQIESFDSVSIPANGTEIEFTAPELKCCELVPLNLKFTKHNYPYLNGIMTLAFKDLNGNLSETMEFPVTFHLIWQHPLQHNCKGYFSES